jgi:hypothetical protein
MSPTKTIALVLALGTLLAGCGGEGGSTTNATSPTARAAKNQAKPTPAAAPERTDSHGEGSRRASESSPAADPSPLPNQGTKAVGPGVPLAKGGDNSIQTYGVEATSTERAAATAIARAYLAAQASANWPLACSYLAGKVRSGLEEFAAKAGPSSALQGCAGGMALLLGKTSQDTLKRAADIHVLSLRIAGPQAFIIYRDATGTPYNLPFTREHHTWRISALVGIELTH